MFPSHEDEEVDTEQPQWAADFASASGGLAAAGPGKLPLPSSGGPQPYPLYDSSSSSDSDEEHPAATPGEPWWPLHGRHVLAIAAGSAYLRSDVKQTSFCFYPECGFSPLTCRP